MGCTNKEVGYLGVDREEDGIEPREWGHVGESVPDVVEGVLQPLLTLVATKDPSFGGKPDGHSCQTEAAASGKYGGDGADDRILRDIDQPLSLIGRVAYNVPARKNMRTRQVPLRNKQPIAPERPMASA